MRADVPEEKESLWRLVASPAIWAGHFLLCYGVAAVWCAKFAEPDQRLGPVRVGILAVTVLALLGVGVLGRDGYRRHRLPGGEGPHAADTAEDRHRFLGLATLLLSGLSALAIVYEAFAVVLIRSCR